jgi:hypothetical protein
MRPFLLIVYLLTLATAHSQRVGIPSSFSETFTKLELDKKYERSAFLSPTFIQADFNGDGVQDVAIMVMAKASKKSGVMVIHGNSTTYFVFGAGTNFGSGSDDFNWADKWLLYNKRTAYETQFDKNSGDISGSKTVKLNRPGLLVESEEDGAGGIIYWNGKKYIWIHQGE